MKRSLLIFLASICLQLLSAQIVIDRITASTDNPVVSRVAITLSEKTPWSYSVDTDRHLVIVSIKNCDESNPPITGFTNNKLISSIDFDGSYAYRKVILTVTGPFLLETSSGEKPFRIFLDVFAYHKKYSHDDYMAQIRFYEQTKQWSAASKEYSRMLQAYPQSTDGYYLWANVLIQLDKLDTAKAKLRLVAKDSKYYQATQQLLSKLENKEPVETAPTQPDQPVTEPTQEPLQQAASDTVAAEPQPTNGELIEINPDEVNIRFFSFRTFFGKSWKEICQTGFMSRLASLPIWFWLIVLVIFIILVLIIVDLLFKRKHKTKTPEAHKENAQAIDVIKQGMVIKLLENGWNDKEIARELMLSLPETHLYVKQGRKIIKGKQKRGE